MYLHLFLHRHNYSIHCNILLNKGYNFLNNQSTHLLNIHHHRFLSYLPFLYRDLYLICFHQIANCFDYLVVLYQTCFEALASFVGILYLFVLVLLPTHVFLQVVFVPNHDYLVFYYLLYSNSLTFQSNLFGIHLIYFGNHCSFVSGSYLIELKSCSFRFVIY